MGAERAVARILRADGETAGLAFLVAGGRLVTCAHVVNTALGRSRRNPDHPEGTIDVRFAFTADEVRTATVAAWRPDGIWTPKRDLAVLSLTGPAPVGLPLLPLATSTPQSTAQVQFCGPDGDHHLKHVIGTLLGATGEGLRQIDQRRSGAHQAHPGFSGGPVWNENGEVLGVVRAARGEGTDVNCLDVDWVRENLRQNKPEGVVDILQIGPLRLSESTAEQQIEALCAEVDEDCASRSASPDVIVFCGDLTANATTKEYRLVRGLIDRLTARFGLPLDRVLTVPGRTDVNATMCEAHFTQQAVMEAEPVPPYWSKWMPYSAFLSDLDGEPLAKAEPWRFLEIPELKVVLAGLNTTMAYTHRSEDDSLTLGDGQLAWFFGRLSAPKYTGWQRIAVAHRALSGENDEPRLPQLLQHLDLVLAGSADGGHLGDVRVLTPESGHRLVRLRPSDEDGAREPWRQPVTMPWVDLTSRPRESFVDRVVTALELEYPDAQLHPIEYAPVPYIRVIKRYRSGDRLIPSDEMLIGVEPREATTERIESFRRLVDQFRVPGARSVYPFVYFGRLATEEATAFARRHQILLQSFAEFQFKWDPRHFTEWQLRELNSDGRYPAEIYIPQRFREFGHGDVAAESTSVGLTDRVLEWFGQDQSHLIVVLGSAGTGKTFFMRMLARQMSASESAPTPVYLQLRDLERIPLLDELVARQFAKAREHRLPGDRFNYYLREGRIALLLDGLDELTVQGSWDKAVQYLTEIREKVTGKAMIVVTARDEEFLSNKQIEQVLRAGTGSIGRRAFKLEHFTLEQVDQFLAQHLGSAEAGRERMELLKTFGPIPDVARNPRMLSFLAEIDTDRLVRAREAGARLGAAELYRQVIEQWKDREEARLRRDDYLPALDRAQLWEAVRRLALNLWQTGRERLTVEELGGAAQILSHVDADAQVHQISSASLLIRFDDGRLGFIHRSLQEWFLAEAIVNDPDVADALAAQRLSNQTAVFIAEMSPEIELRAPTAWSPVDPRTSVFQGNAGLLSKHLPERVSTPDAPILDYSGADLRGFSSAGQSVRGTSFRNSQSAGADFSGQDLTGTDWTGADLRGANFNGAILRNAVLAADLTGAKLLGADLTGANLTGVKLDRAALTGAKVTAEQLARASSNGAAMPDIGPSGTIRPSVAGAVAAPNPQGTVLATGSEHGWIHLWSLPDLRPIRSWKALPGEVRALEWSGDGSQMLVGGAGPLRCWLADGTLDRTMGGNLDNIWTMSWNPVDGRVACGTGYPYQQLSIITQDHEVHLDPYQLGPTPIADLAWSPNGAILAVAPKHGRLVLLSEGGKLVSHSFADTPAEIVSLAWAPDSGTLAILLTDRVALMDLATRTVVRRRMSPGSRLNAVAWSCDGASILTGDENSIVTDVLSVEESFSFGTGDRFIPSRIGELRDGHTFAHGTRSTLVWRSEPATPLTSRADLNDSIRSAAWSPDGSRIVSANVHGRLRIWSARLGTATTFHGVFSRLLVDWAPDGDHVATVDLHGRAKVISLSGKEVGAMIGDDMVALFAVRWSPGGGLIATGRENGRVRLHKTPSFGPAGGWRLSGQIGDLLWSGEKTLFASDRRGVAKLTVGDGASWKAEFGTPPTALRSQHDDRRIAVALSDGSIQILDQDTGDIVDAWIAHSGPVRSLAQSPTRGVLASGGDDGTIRLWHGTVLKREWTAHDGRVTALDYSPDGRHLLSAGDDGVLQIWNGTTGNPVATLVPFDGNGSAAFNDRGFKVDGDLNGEFWYASGQVALDPLELARHTDMRRLARDEPLWD